MRTLNQPQKQKKGNQEKTLGGQGQVPGANQNESNTQGNKKPSNANNNNSSQKKGNNNKTITKTSFFQPSDYSLDILSEAESSQFTDSLNNYFKECRGFYELSEYMDLGSKDPKKSEIKHKVQPLNMKHILVGLKSITRALRNQPEKTESVVLIYEKESHDILESVMQLCNRKGVRLILLQKSQRRRLMDITGVKRFNGLAIMKFNKTEKGLEKVNSFASKCKSSFTWTINPEEFKPLRLKVQTIQKE